MENFSVRWLDHSGFLVETRRSLLVFDCYNREPQGGGLEDGVVDVCRLPDKPLFVFASHRHQDHFSPFIFEWGRRREDVTYLLSNDIRPRKGEEGLAVRRMKALETLELPGLRVETLLSTDTGVAFLAEADGVRLYHGGDLGWWHWEEEPEAWNRQMAGSFKKEMSRLRGREFDAAFFPTDPRLGKAEFWGLELFLKEARPRLVVPMHFWGDFTVFDRLEKAARDKGWTADIARFSRRGEVLSRTVAGKKI